jgi:hypothetical protein
MMPEDDVHHSNQEQRPLEINTIEGNLFQRISNFFSMGAGQQHASRNRQNMLQFMWNTWIEGVLKKSLYNEMLIQPGMETRPDAVDHPWDMAMQIPDCEPKLVPRGTKPIETFDQANGSLLILGEAGAGKTTMLLELARQLTERAQNDPMQPVPVVFNLSSWTPRQSLAEWLVEELRGIYHVSIETGRPWVEGDELLLLLDGLDEVKAENREECVQAINAFQAEHAISLGVCSRKQAYEALPTRLKLHNAVLIRPLDDDQVDDYLSAVDEKFVAPYKSLVRSTEQLDCTEEERKFLHTPLFLSLLVSSYQEASATELQALAASGDYSSHLLDHYINEMSAHHETSTHRKADQCYDAEKTKGWLAWLATKMIEKEQPIFFPEIMRRNWLSSGKQQGLHRILSGLLVMTFGGVFGGILWYGIGLLSILNVKRPFDPVYFESIRGLSFFSIIFIIVSIYLIVQGVMMGGILGMVLGIIIALAGWLPARSGPGWCDFDNHRPAEKFNWSWPKTRRGCLFGALVAWPVALLISIIFYITGEESGSICMDTIIPICIMPFVMWLYLGLPAGLSGGMISGLKGTEKIEIRSKAGEAIRASLRNALRSGFLFGLLIGALLWFPVLGMFAYKYSLQELYEQEVFTHHFFTGYIIPVMWIGAVLAALRFGGGFVVSHFSLRLLLSRAGHIPWRLIAFLDYCTERVFLRKVGGGYIFIHRMLMEHFAAMDNDKGS